MADDNGTEDTGTDEGTEDTGTDEGTENEENEGKDGGYTAPDEAEWKRTTSALAKSKAERTKLRRELAELKASKDDEGKDTKDKGPDPEVRVKTVAVTAALIGSGLTRSQAKRAAKLVDLNDVEVDSDGDADLDEVIADLREEFPGLFKDVEAGSRATARPRTSGGRSKDAGNTKNADEKNTDALLRAAGYR